MAEPLGVVDFFVRFPGQDLTPENAALEERTGVHPPTIFDKARIDHLDAILFHHSVVAAARRGDKLLIGEA